MAGIGDYLKKNWASLLGGAVAPNVGRWAMNNEGGVMQDAAFGAGLGALGNYATGNKWQSGIIPGAGASYLSGGVQNKLADRNWGQYSNAAGGGGGGRGVGGGGGYDDVRNRGGSSSFLGDIPDAVKYGGLAALGTYALTSANEESDIEKIKASAEAVSAPVLDNEVKYEQAKITKERSLGRPLTKSEERDLRLSFGLDKDPPIPMNTGTRDNPKYARGVADGGYIQKYQEGGSVSDDGALTKELYEWETFLNGQEPSDYDWARAQERHGIVPSASESSRDAMQKEAIDNWMPSYNLKSGPPLDNWMPNYDLKSGPPRQMMGGGYAHGPGGPKDDMIDARLSDGEFVLTADAVNGAGGPGPLYDMMDQLEDRR